MSLAEEFDMNMKNSKRIIVRLFAAAVMAAASARGGASAAGGDPLTYSDDGTTVLSCDKEVTGEVVIPEGIKKIDGGAFYSCTGLKSVILPESLEEIRDLAFANCTGLKNITIPAKVERIDIRTFNGCAGLTGFTVKAGSAHYCSQDGILFSKDMTTLVRYPEGKTGASYTIPEGVKSLGKSAFYHCALLQTLTLPESLTSLGLTAFVDLVEGCTGLTGFIVKAGNEKWSSQDGVLFNKARTILLQCPEGKTGAYAIPPGVTAIDPVAFERCAGLTGVVIPASLTSIGVAAFKGCVSLKSVNIPEGVKEIGAQMFFGCASLNNMTIPETVTRLGDKAFSGCAALKNVTIPEGVKEIGDEVFAGTAWYESQGDGVVYAGKVAYRYKGVMPANTSITLRNGTVSVADHAFDNCAGLKSVTMPGTVKSIGYGAFARTGLESAALPEGVTVIGFAAFYDCAALKSVILPESVTRIEGNAFVGCDSLVYLSIPEGVKEIGAAALSWNGWYKSQADGVVYAGKAVCAYKGVMPEHTVIQLRDDTKIIAESAFYECYGLERVVIPASVESIGKNAFIDCTGLKTVTFEGDALGAGDFGQGAFPGGSLKEAYLAGGAGTYRRDGDGPWTRE